MGLDRHADCLLDPHAGAPGKSKGSLAAPGIINLDLLQYFHDIENMEQIEVVDALAALAQDTRLNIFRLLVRTGPDGLPAGQIAETLGLPATTLSFHLNQLRQAGLIDYRRESRSLIYAAEYDAMNGLIAYLTENCCQGDASACGPGTAKMLEPALTEEKKGSSR